MTTTIASLLVEAQAPGCHKLTREVRLITGLEHVELINIVDKKRIEVDAKPGDWKHASYDNKEGVHFGFAFNVPNGVMRMDIPWAMARPEADQLPGACKNWLTVGRWVDVSNDNHGITWATLDAPLIEVGSITSFLQWVSEDGQGWIRHLDPKTQIFYSFVMNNHWFTNYRAYQEGPTRFRYALRPHEKFQPGQAKRFGLSVSQPLLAFPAVDKNCTESRLRVKPDHVLITDVKPSDDGKALIIRLFAAGDQNAEATLNWSDPQPKSLWLSDLGEKPLRKINNPIKVPAWGIVTLRARFNEKE